MGPDMTRGLELGQMLFGQQGHRYSAGTDCEILIEAIRYALESTLRTLGKRVPSPESPFSNSGTAFRCDVFGVWAYQRGDEAQPCNFFHFPTGLSVSWYKYPGRSMSSNRHVTEALGDEILLSCLDALFDIRIGLMDYTLGGLGEIPYPERMVP